VCLPQRYPSGNMRVNRRSTCAFTCRTARPLGRGCRCKPRIDARRAAHCVGNGPAIDARDVGRIVNDLSNPARRRASCPLCPTTGTGTGTQVRPKSTSAVPDPVLGQVLKTPVRARQANAHCERFIGTARRECLDWMIPLNERHLRSALLEWISHYNGERPHSALGPGLPDSSKSRTPLTGHRLPAAHRVVGSARLGGLHHHYELEPIAA
jgi:Integrase core domain